ncbi:MAG: Cell surface protein [Ignavibacteriae bacterium]|nr:MAG: Cell surface protein [Ignavibacteriota bacterium]
MKILLIILALLTIFFANYLFCTTHTITNMGFVFNPSIISINLGDTVNFVLESMHNAIEVSEATWNTNGKTPNGGFATPFGGGKVILQSVGTYYYVCSPYAAFGMKGKIIVVASTGSIRGTKFNDVNGNCIMDPNESGLPGWTINLSGPVSLSTTTGSNGIYFFGSLPAGTYTVSEVLQAGWTQTCPATPGTYTINLSAGQQVSGIDFGNRLDSCVTAPSDMVAWYPLDEQSGATMVNDIAPAPGSTVIDVGTTQPGPIGGGVGPYSVAGKVGGGALYFLGPYYVDIPHSADLTFPGDFSIDAWISVVDCGWSGGGVLAPVVDKWDPNTQTGFSLFVDQPIPSTGFLKFQLNNQLFTCPTSLPTGANPMGNTGPWVHIAVTVDYTTGVGTFYINGTSAGTFTPPTGSVTNTLSLLVGDIRVPAANKCEIAIDELELFNRALGSSEIYSIWSADSLGKCKPATGSIRGTKFNDVNGNCIMDPNESGLPGWTINLSGPVSLSTTTGSNGIYFFGSLPAGTYTVSEVLQAGWTQTCPATPGTYTINLSAGQQVSGIDFGNKKTIQICPTCPDSAIVQRYNNPTTNDLDDMGFSIPTNPIKRITRNLVIDTCYVYTTGYSKDAATNFDYLTVKMDYSGNILWTVRYDRIKKDDKAHSICIDDSGNVYVTGQTHGGSATNIDITTIKYDPNGTQVWVNHYNNSLVNKNDIGYAIAFDKSGNYVYVTGVSRFTSDDYITICYNASTGAIVWASNYNGPGNKTDIAYAIAVDPSGDVAVTGISVGNGTNFDYATIKYKGGIGGGTPLWVERYDFISKKDFAFAISIDNSGNVYVTGTSQSQTKFDYATIKYASSGGPPLWVMRYNNSSMNGNDYAYHITLDAAGDVYVTGASQNKILNVNKKFDYTTIKYDVNGNQLWVNKFDGGINKDDIAVSVASCDQGNAIFVTGSSDQGPSRKWDFLTLKIDMNTGTTLWSGRYNHSSNLTDMAYNIAVRQGNCCLVVNGRSQDVSTKIDYAVVIGPSNAPFPAPVIVQNELNEIENQEAPTEFALYQNHPNPFNPVTNIKFSLPEISYVTLKIYNVLGQELMRIFNRELIDEGIHEVQFDASNLPSGVYFYILDAEPLDDNYDAKGSVHRDVKKMVIIK